MLIRVAGRSLERFRARKLHRLTKRTRSGKVVDVIQDINQQLPIVWNIPDYVMRFPTFPPHSDDLVRHFPVPGHRILSYLPAYIWLIRSNSFL